ncbi:hypothetical protein [Aliarcobacter butzleri]|uniref:hypothetical protein n=1 Tax=Aliarcobacter butzleri TaxID=28197 RepID=UPI003AF9D1FA
MKKENEKKMKEFYLSLLSDEEILEELSPIKTSLQIDFNIENPSIQDIKVIFMALSSYIFGMGIQECFDETETRYAIWEFMQDEKEMLIQLLR